MKKYLIATAVLVALFLVAFGAPVASAESGTNCITPVQTMDWGGGLPMYTDYRVRVCNPGDSAILKINFKVSAHVYLLRVATDDLPVTFTYNNGATSTNLLPLLQMGPVTTAIPSDAALRATLASRGVNTAAGELLVQNYNIVDLGTVPVGASLYFEVKDDASLRVNRGLLVSLGDAGDNFTVDLQGNKLNLPAIAASATMYPLAPAGVFAQWKEYYKVDSSKAIEGTSVNLPLSLDGRLITFTYDAPNLDAGFTAVKIGGQVLDCKKVANPSQQLPTVVCRKGDKSTFKAGDVINVSGTYIFQVWGQASSPTPATDW